MISTATYIVATLVVVAAVVFAVWLLWWVFLIALGLLARVLHLDR
jgi:hypothetical protein